MKNLGISGSHWVVDGVKKSTWRGRDSFKLLMWVANGKAPKAERWIERNQKLLGQDVVLRVLGETEGWEGHPMFGGYPKDPGVWDIEDIRERIRRNDRPIKRLTPLNETLLKWMCEQSQKTGVAFEYVCIATLKHTKGPGGEHGEWLTTGVGDHAIRQTAAYLRELISVKNAPYPRAKIIFHSCNEWGAHNKWKMTTKKVNDWSDRFYRWARVVDGDREHRLQYKSPGSDWVAEQWPEGFITVDGTTGHDIQIGHEPGYMKMSLEHPDRDRQKWWELPPTYQTLRDDARGQPFGYNESMMIAEAGEEERLTDWYGRKGWTVDLPHYLEWMENCDDAVRYFIIHDEAGMQADGDAPMTDLERELGGYEPPSPPPPPPPKKVSYRKIVTQAYREVLGRKPDPGGLEHHNGRMRGGLTEAELREGFIRSEEFRRKNVE